MEFKEITRWVWFTAYLSFAPLIIIWSLTVRPWTEKMLLMLAALSGLALFGLLTLSSLNMGYYFQAFISGLVLFGGIIIIIQILVDYLKATLSRQ